MNHVNQDLETMKIIEVLNIVNIEKLKQMVIKTFLNFLGAKDSGRSLIKTEAKKSKSKERSSDDDEPSEPRPRNNENYRGLKHRTAKTNGYKNFFKLFRS